MNDRHRENYMTLLRERFEANLGRHGDCAWDDVRTRLEADPGKIDVLKSMEESGGEPDAIGVDPATGEILYCDCSPESPAGRRGLCYDGEARASRKEHMPEGSAVESARAMGIELLDEGLYRKLQALGAFDLKTSSWILTPPRIRRLGGALFGDRRYGTVFVYHNGAESYYAVRGFRGLLRIA